MKTFKIFNKRENKKYQFTQKWQKQDKRHLPKFLPLTIQFFKKDDELYKKYINVSSSENGFVLSHQKDRKHKQQFYIKVN